jgi:hypothetical protein
MSSFQCYFLHTPLHQLWSLSCCSSPFHLLFTYVWYLHPIHQKGFVSCCSLSMVSILLLLIRGLHPAAHILASILLILSEGMCTTAPYLWSLSPTSHKESEYCCSIRLLIIRVYGISWCSSPMVSILPLIMKGLYPAALHPWSLSSYSSL